ncbi:hypothetical protein DPMN_037779 [Dreissena polymorpha]|uniref:Helix-hairpin-helix domain-containing protein n=1 Tax=Dreissena polymorpha TaxID=45954 RepID=A0A9D4ME69_DREPO|nr:hypothetical protein DPMN_037779 [Dreissena polymorpha]
MSCVGQQLIRVNFYPPQALKAVSGVGPKFALEIVQVRESAGNFDPETLHILIRRPFTDREKEFLDFLTSKGLFSRP